MKKEMLMLALALSLPACSLMAQNDGPPDGGPQQSRDVGPGDGGPGGPGGPGGRGHRPPPMPIIMALDTNHDGVLSGDEIANAPKALLTLDKNGDGQLTRDEYMPPHPQRPGMTNADDQAPTPPPDDSAQGGRPRRPLPPIIAALDTNHDGIISADEIANAAASLLKLDKNGDGQLTRDEFAPRPPHGPGGPGGPGGFGGPNGQDDGPPPPPPDGSGPGDGAPPPPDQN